MTLRSRLALAFGLVALVVSIVVGGSSFRATRSEVASSTDAFLESRATAVLDGRRATPRSSTTTGRTRASTTIGLAFDPDAIVQVVDEGGDAVISSGAALPVTDRARRLIEARRPNAGGLNGVFDDIEIDDEAHRMFTVALPQGGALQVARSTQADQELVSSLFVRFALIALAATAGASLLGWWIARRTTRPLRRLAGVASGVAATGDLSVEVPVEGDDEIAQVASSLRTMLAALETSRHQQHRLVQDAGHELRTPLTSLRANVALLERLERLEQTGQRPDRRIDPEERAAVLAAITAEVAELGSLFDELIALAGDSADRDTPLVPVRLDDVVGQAVAKWQQRTGRTIEVHTRPATVNGDAAQIERAVTNLIGNAHKFSPVDEPIEVVVDVSEADPPGGAAGRIAGGRAGRKAGDTSTMAGVAVRDGGPGIPVEDRPLVFDRFHRAATTRAMPGSGLGLAIVAQVVQQHGGTTWVGESDRGGAEVGFRLPLLDDQAVESTGVATGVASG